MHNKINKIIWIIILMLLVIFSILVVYDKNYKKVYTKKYFYMDTYIYVKLYTNKNKANEAFNEIDEIYKEYHELTDRYNSYKNIKNIYYIKNNEEKNEYIKIDKKLYDIIKYGKEWYYKSNGLIDISLGNIIDVWKKYRDNEEGIPSSSELVRNNTIEDIILEKNKIKNNKVDIDLGAIAKGYTTKIVGEYLEKNGINKYLINAGGNVLVGSKYNKIGYTIGIENPNVKNDVFTILKGENISVVTSGGYERFYEVDGIKYHHIINPNTLNPANNMKSVTIITKDSALADILSTYLFLMNIDEGKEYIESLDNVEAIWYTNDDQIIKSKGVDKYEYKNK